MVGDSKSFFSFGLYVLVERLLRPEARVKLTMLLIAVNVINTLIGRLASAS
jgi:hypothetical protein